MFAKQSGPGAEQLQNGEREVRRGHTYIYIQSRQPAKAKSVVYLDYQHIRHKLGCARGEVGQEDAVK